MFNCHHELTTFHDTHVRLTDEQDAQLRDHREANRKRLIEGLKRLGRPKPKSFVEQGSYEMGTINQHPDNDYDIDDGVAFLVTDLVNKDGTAMTPLQAREMVRDAVRDPSFNRAPEVRPNCVRVFYAGGYCIDMPVYRIMDAAKPEELQLAGGETWRQAAPRQVTVWFNEANKSKSPNQLNGGQFRRNVSLIKFYTRSRKSWRLPSGLIMSKLTDERFVKNNGRDDETLVNLMKSVHLRLLVTLSVQHPVLNEEITKGPMDPKMIELRDRLGETIKKLTILSDSSCTRLQALQAWQDVFSHSYWAGLIEEEREKEKEREKERQRQEESTKAAAASILQHGRQPSEPIRKGGGNGYGHG
jgi:hypothetical protein